MNWAIHEHEDFPQFRMVGNEPVMKVTCLQCKEHVPLHEALNTYFTTLEDMILGSLEVDLAEQKTLPFLSEEQPTTGFISAPLRREDSPDR